MNQNHNQMDQLTERAEQLIDSLSGAILSTAETAAEKIHLASQVAAIRQRMAAHQYVLEAIAAQKAETLERLAAATGALKAAYARQVQILDTQEVGILKSLGVEEDVAEASVNPPALEDQSSNGKLYARNGRRFEPIANGSE